MKERNINKNVIKKILIIIGILLVITVIIMIAKNLSKEKINDIYGAVVKFKFMCLKFNEA